MTASRIPRVHTYRPAPPYWFTLHLEGFSVPGEPMPWIYEPGGKCCRRLYRLPGGEKVPVETCFHGEPWSPEIRIHVYADSGRLADEAARLVLEAVRAGFDYNVFVEKLSPWPALLKVARLYPGLRPGRSLSLYEALVDSIVKQRIALKAALRVQSRLVKSYGSHVALNGLSFYSSPSPERIVKAETGELRKVGLTRMKAEAIKSVAEAELEGRLPSVDEAVEAEDPSGIIEELARLRGVGPWTAELALAQVHPLFPVGPRSDLAVNRGLRMLGLKPGEAGEVLRGLGEHAGLLMYLAAFHYEASKKRRNREA